GFVNAETDGVSKRRAREREGEDQRERGASVTRFIAGWRRPSRRIVVRHRRYFSGARSTSGAKRKATPMRFQALIVAAAIVRNIASDSLKCFRTAAHASSQAASSPAAARTA